MSQTSAYVGTSFSLAIPRNQLKERTYVQSGFLKHKFTYSILRHSQKQKKKSERVLKKDCFGRTTNMAFGISSSLSRSFTKLTARPRVLGNSKNQLTGLPNFWYHFRQWEWVRLMRYIPCAWALRSAVVHVPCAALLRKKKKIKYLSIYTIKRGKLKIFSPNLDPSYPSGWTHL